VFDFVSEPEPEIGWVARFSTAKRAAAFEVALRNAIAVAETPEKLASDVDLEALRNSYRVSDEDAAAAMRRVLRQAVECVYADGKVCVREHEELDALVAALELPASEFERVVELVAEGCYREHV